MSIVRRTWAVLAGLTVACLAVDRAAAAPQATPTPDLTGTWVLSRDLSDRPGQGGDRDGGGGGGRRPGGGGMGRPGADGRNGGGRGGGGMPDREEMERMRATMQAVVRAPERLIIVKADPGLVVTDEEGVSTRLALDGSKETGAVNGVTFESATKWEDGKLRVERKFKGGLKLVETYSVSVNPRLLTVSAHIEGGRMGAPAAPRIACTSPARRPTPGRRTSSLPPLVAEAHRGLLVEDQRPDEAVGLGWSARRLVRDPQVRQSPTADDATPSPRTYSR